VSGVDVIDRLVGIAPGSPLDAVRAQRAQARDNAQASYLALFHPADAGEMSLLERHAVAYFVAAQHRQPDIAAFYAEGVAALGPALDALSARGLTSGPYGRYPAGPLSAEDTEGPVFETDSALGPRLSAALAHAHMLVFHPRDASAEALRRLEKTGWSATGIVTLSQLVAFLSFQIRVILGLRALAAAPIPASETP
jgi:CMD domain protein